MMTPLLLLVLLLSPGSAPAVFPPETASNDSAAVIATHRAWWRAFTLGDTTRLQQLSAPGLTATMSTGRILTRAEALADARSRGDSTTVRLAWDNEAVTIWNDVAVVTSRFIESIGNAQMEYRFMTVVARERGTWRVAAVQSTRITPPTAAVAVPAATLAQYAGTYKNPGGQTFRIAVRDGSLAIATPQGREDPLTPIAPTVFELSAAMLRFVFERDENGRVFRLVVLRPGGAVLWEKLP